MVVKRIDTGTITCTTTTATGTIGLLYGKILKIECVSSASSDFWIYCDASTADDGNIVDEDILGATGTKITVNTTLIIYPVVAEKTVANATTDPDAYSPLIISGTVKYGLANVAASDTFRIVIYYEPFSG